MQSHKNLPLLCALIVNAAVLSLGVDIWFRNEAGTHLLWFQNHPEFWDALKYPGMIQHYRPVSFFMLSVIYHLFGTTALPYVLANFVGFLFTLVVYYIFVRHLTSNTVAYFSAIALFPLFFQVLYYPFNALHGIFYSWDVGWFCLSMYLFLKAFEVTDNRNRYLILAAITSVIALGTHAFSGLTLAAVIITYLVFNFPAAVRNRTALIVGLGISIGCLGLIPVLEPGGGKLLQPGATLLGYVSERSGLLAQILMTPRVALVLFGGTVQAVAHHLSRGRSTTPLWAVVSAGIAVLVLKVLPQDFGQTALLVCLVALLSFIVIRIPSYRIFAVMALMGIVHYFLVRSESSNYLRFLVFGSTPIAVIGMVSAFEGLFAWIKVPSPHNRLLPRFGAYVTALVLIAIGLGSMNVSVARSPVRKIRYLSEISRTFREVLFLGTQEIPRSSQVYFFRGGASEDASKYSRTQAHDKSALYTREHLSSLRPAKYYEYPSYFEIAGRDDLHFHHVEDGVSAAPEEPAYIIALNFDEVRQAKTLYPAAESIFRSHIGEAEAAIFKVSSPASRSGN